MKSLKKVLVGVSIFILVILAVSIYVKLKKAPFDMATAEVDFGVSTSELTKEFTVDYAKAKEKYFSGNSNPKVLALTGEIFRIDKNLRGNITVLLKSNKNSPYGVYCTFSNKDLNFSIGETVKVKGLLNAGFHYDADLDLYENAILDKSVIVK